MSDYISFWMAKTAVEFGLFVGFLVFLLFAFFATAFALRAISWIKSWGK